VRFASFLQPVSLSKQQKELSPQETIFPGIDSSRLQESGSRRKECHCSRFSFIAGGEHSHRNYTVIKYAHMLHEVTIFGFK
jgi:hypothetical protein